MKKFNQSDASLENEARHAAAKREHDEVLQKTGEAPKEEPKRKKPPKQIVLETTPEGVGFFSNKKNIVRVVLFFAALGIAIFFITNAVRMMIEKEPGWYDIETDVDESVPYYSSGVTLRYELTGSGGENSATYKAVKDAYESSLKSAYKLTDAQRAYDGVENVASINARLDEKIALGEELFAILLDAAQRAGVGYSALDGVFAHIRDSLVYSENGAAGDPTADGEVAAMLEEYSQIPYGLENEFSSSDLLEPILAETDDGRVRLVGRGAQLTLYPKTREATLEVSEKITAFLEKYEMDDCPILDLDTLRRAYILEAVARDIGKEGFDSGYITSDDGLTVLLPGAGDSEICLYSLADGDDGEQSAVSATYRAGGGSAVASLRVFALYDGEYGFYTADSGGEALYRHKFMRDFGDGAILAALAASDSGDVVGATRVALELLASPDASAARSLAAQSDGFAVIYEAKDGRGTLFSNAKDGVSVNMQAGFSAKYVG